MMHSNMAEAASSRDSGKIAIPRLGRPPPPPPASKKSDRKQEDRIVRACEPCRKRKTRCTGAMPCANCLASGIHCVYAQARRDRLRDAMDKNQTLSNLLRNLSLRVDNADKQRIEDALDDLEDDLVSQGTSSTPRSEGKRSHKTFISDEAKETGSLGEAHVSGSIGSNEELDHLNEDLMSSADTRAAGYYGKNSDVQWLNSVQRQTEHIGAELRDQPYGPPGSSNKSIRARSDALHERRKNAGAQPEQSSIKDSTFYLDNEDIDLGFVNPTEQPDPKTAERLFGYYIKTVHSSYPLLPDNFEREFRTHLQQGQKQADDKPMWLAQMNLILAIGAKHSHLVDAESASHDDDHLLYMRRAVRLLALRDSIIVLSSPSLPLVQAISMLAFYFMTIGHVSRAWIMIGISVRLALALGLHLRNEDPNAKEADKISHIRTWWTLHSVECLISIIIGRPTTIPFADCTVPLPYSMDEEERDDEGGPPRKRSAHRPVNTRSAHRPSEAKYDRFFASHVKRMVIVQEVLLNLYSPRTASESWHIVEEQMSEALKKLEAWSVEALPRGVRSWEGKQKSSFDREEFLLKMDYWSTTMLITRPCVCRLSRRIQNESNTSIKFNASSAETCVDAALSMVELFPNEPDPQFMYEQGPWWAMNNFVMQSTAVLLLETVYKSRESDSVNPSIIASIKKMIRWLRAMEGNDPISKKALKVVRKLLRGVTPNLQAVSNNILDSEEDFSAPEHLGMSRDDQPNQSRRRDTAHPDPIFGDDLLDAHQQVQLDAFEDAPGPLQSQFYQPTMPFGNPFWTFHDQASSFANMPDFWTGLGSLADPGGFDPEWQNFDAALDPTGNNDFDPNPDYTQGE